MKVQYLIQMSKKLIILAKNPENIKISFKDFSKGQNATKVKCHQHLDLGYIDYFMYETNLSILICRKRTDNKTSCT